MTMLPPELPPNAHTRAINAVSYVLVAAMIAAVLWLH
ncbi:permease, partial [Enterobacteriaceae bacterium 8376wD7]|nr:permease [Enterobacteriaceae bacterium 8376wD7]